MSECPECNAMARELRREQKRTTVLVNALVSIHGITKDNMWYPSNFEERGEDGFKAQQEFIDADLKSVKHDGYTK